MSLPRSRFLRILILAGGLLLLCVCGFLAMILATTPPKSATATVGPPPVPTATETLSPPRTPRPTRTPVLSRTPVPTRTPRPTRTPVPTKMIVPTLTANPTVAAVAPPTATLPPPPTVTPLSTAAPAGFVPLLGHLFDGVKVYFGAVRAYGFEVLGGSNRCPGMPSGRGVLVLYPDGATEWKDRLHLIESGLYFVKADDPNISSYLWTSIVGCR